MSDIYCKKNFVKNFIRKFESHECYRGLRELESAIRNAYVIKELEAQMRESEVDKLAVRTRERLFNENVKLAGEEFLRKEEEEKRFIELEKKNYGAELRDAVMAKEMSILKAREIDRREGKIFEEVSRVMEEREEANKIYKRFLIAEEKLKEFRIFQEVREIRRDQAKEKIVEKEAEDLNYLRMIDERNERIKKTREECEIARKIIVESVACSLLELREKKLEFEKIIEDLMIEEKLVEEEMKIAKDEERRRAAKEETAIVIERQKRFIEERKRRHAVEEKEFAAAVMRRVLQDSRVERLTAEARRRKQIDYRRALELVIIERRNRRAEEILKLEESIRLERIRDAEVDKRVKKMRENLLLRHAKNVAKFIAVGTLSLEERNIIDELIDSGSVTADKLKSAKK